MKERAKAIFTEHEKPSHASRRDVHGQLGPITRLIADVRKQVLEYQMLIQELEHAAENPAAYPILEHMHQTFGSIERTAGVLATSARQLGLDFVQLDRYMEQAKSDITLRIVPLDDPEGTGSIIK